jgi:dihydrofolate reductase
MGKNTWMSLPKQHKPLKERLNVVVSSTLTKSDISSHDSVVIVTSLQDAIEHVVKNLKVHNAFVIGGARLYNEALLHPLFKKAYVTQVEIDSQCDTFIDLSTLESNFICQQQGTLVMHNNLSYRFCEFIVH